MQKVHFIVCELYFNNTIFIEKGFSVFLGLCISERLVKTMKTSPRKMLTCPSSQNAVRRFGRLPTHMLIVPGLRTPNLMYRLAFKDNTFPTEKEYLAPNHLISS